MPDTDPPFPATPLRLLCWPPLPAEVLRTLRLDGELRPIDVTSLAQARALLADARAWELAAVSAEALGEPAAWAALARQGAVVLREEGDPADPAVAARWRDAAQRGLQDVFGAADWHLPAVALRLRAAVWRNRQARETRLAYATDLATGLPHRQQLLEHMTQLLALRAREPAPMAVLVLRVEGFASAAARLGAEAAAILRRKLAVRLRAALRASDVVATLDDDRFAVLLAFVDAPAHVDGVCAKLTQAVQRPLSVGGASVALAVAVGLQRHPQDGSEATALLQAAAARADAGPALGREGFANRVEAGPARAANDDAG